LLRNLIDIDGVYEAMHNAGIQFGDRPNKDDLSRIVAVFSKAPQVDPSGTIAGRRTTILTEADMRMGRITRAIVGTTIACALGDPMIYVSGSEPFIYQAPVAVIVRTK
jgi:cyanuric acid amidohydrolase